MWVWLSGSLMTPVLSIDISDGKEIEEAAAILEGMKINDGARAIRDVEVPIQMQKERDRRYPFMWRTKRQME